jgi:chromosome segregation ATPase
MRNEMIDTNATIDETKDTIEEMKETISQFQKEKKKHLLSIQQLTDTSENRRIFAVLLTLRLGVEQRRLYFALESMTLHRNQLQDELDQTKEQLANAHRAIVLHVKSNEVLQAQINPLKQWCKKSHSHRKKLEELIVRFEIEMSAARDAIWR